MQVPGGGAAKYQRLAEFLVKVVVGGLKGVVGAARGKRADAQARTAELQKALAQVRGLPACWPDAAVG